MKRKTKLFCAVLCTILIIYVSAFMIEIKSKQIASSSFTKDYQVTQVKAAEIETSPTIMLDAGHGGYDSGGVSIDGKLEKDITLAITLNVGYYLSEAGYEVAYTRQSDEVLWSNDNLEDLQTRIAMAQEVNASYYVSLHTNSSSYNDGAYGFETYLDYEDEGIEEMALAIHEELVSLNYSIDRGLKDTNTSSLYVIDANPIPALLLEIGFLSDSDDATYISENSTTIAQAIANGIIQALEK